MFTRFVLLSLITIVPAFGYAQHLFQEEPVRLKEVRVISSRLEDFAVGATVEKPDSALVKMYRDEPLSSLLTNVSGVSVKTYGAGGLASVSLRGGQNNHTAVLWNGINIQSPMNGGVNLSAMPVRFFNNVEIQHGGSGTLFGSGAVSGGVHLSGNDLLQMPNQLNATATRGSYGFESASAGFKTGSKNFGSRVSVFGQRADNDFSFSNTSRINSPNEIQTNAGIKQYGVLNENNWRISERSLITAGLWYQFYDKDLQTLMTSRRPNNTNQTDENYLASANYKYYGDNGIFVLTQGFIRNKVIYSNPVLVDSQSDNNSLSYISEAEYKHGFGKLHSVKAGLKYIYEHASSDGYADVVSRNRLTLFASGRYGLSDGKGAAVFSLRNKMSDGHTQPLVASFGLDHVVLNSFRLKGNVSRNYRIPNLNDIHWKEDGYARGNPDLVAESGWSGDLGIDFETGRNGFKVIANTAFFLSKTHDLIVWLPGGEGKWMPHNKRKGEIHGVEAGVKINSLFGKNMIRSNIFYTYTRSLLSTGDDYDGQQMIYTPKNLLNASFSYYRGPLYATIAAQYVGERFYDHDNTLKGYSLLDVMAGYTFLFSDTEADLSLKINNLFSTEYQVVAWYAMSPVNYRISLSITL